MPSSFPPELLQQAGQCPLRLHPHTLEFRKGLFVASFVIVIILHIQVATDRPCPLRQGRPDFLPIRISSRNIE